MLKLKADGLKDSTLQNVSYMLKRISKHADLNQPEQVKLYIASQDVANSYKRNLIKAYNYYAEINEIEWKRPYYRVETNIPTIPTKENIMQVISASRKYATIFKTLMETGLMPYELSKCDETNINFDTRILTAKGYKRHTPRTFKLTHETTAMLKQYFQKYGTFPKSEHMGKMWRQHRNRVAKKLQNPAIHSIRLYDLRHYYATKLYEKTKDILYVKQQMGHTKIETTLIYTQLTTFKEDEEYTCKTATNTKEATELIEAGFDYVIEIDEHKLFRKRK